MAHVVERALAFGDKRFPLQHKAQVVWKKMPVTAGRAQMEQNLIVLSKNLLINEQRVWETVLHEYAHLVVFAKHGHRAMPHGMEWRGIMRRLGLSPEVTHDYECDRRAVRKPYLCMCTRCGEKFGRVRPFKRGRVYHHIGCGGKVRMERAGA